MAPRFPPRSAMSTPYDTPGSMPVPIFDEASMVFWKNCIEPLIVIEPPKPKPKPKPKR